MRSENVAFKTCDCLLYVAFKSDLTVIVYGEVRKSIPELSRNTPP